MDNSSSVEGTMETVDTVIFRAICEIWGKSKRPDEARIYDFVKDFLDDSDVSDGSFWERIKTLEDQGVVKNRSTKCGSSFFLSKKFKNLSTSIVDNSNIGAFYLNSGGLHLNDKGLGRLAINLKLKIRKL